MRPLGIDLGKLAADAHPLSGAPDCPGARVRVTRNDLAQLKSGGEVFQTAGLAIPPDGYGDARVACRSQVEQLANPISGNPTYYGLCRSCSQLESDNRALLRERQKIREGGR